MELLEGEKEQILATVDAILKDQPLERDRLIPALQKVQAELGYLPGPLGKDCAAAGVPAVEVCLATTQPVPLNPQ